MKLNMNSCLVLEAPLLHYFGTKNQRHSLAIQMILTRKI